MTLRHDDQSVTFKVGDTKTFSYNIIESVNRVDVIDIACEEYVQEVLENSESGNPTSTSDLMIDSRSPSFTPFGGSDFLMEEIDAFLEHDDSIPPGVDGIYDSEGDTVYLEELLSVINSDPNLHPSPVCEINVPEKIPIDPLDQEKTTFTCPYGTFAYRRMPFGLCNAPLGTFQRQNAPKVVEDHQSCAKLGKNVTFWYKEGIVLWPLISSKISQHDEMPQNSIKFAKSLTYWGLIYWGRALSFKKEQINILWAVDYLSKWVEAKALPTNDARVVCKFLKSLFARFGAPRAIISKLKTRWSGPFTVTQVFPYGTVELSQNSGPNFKVNGHRLKHYFGGDVPTEDFPDCEDSRALSFIFHSQEFRILSFILGIQNGYLEKDEKRSQIDKTRSEW
ncbi:reverse transcriptase domain-containing protein [Tanacetum coccineum]